MSNTSSVLFQRSVLKYLVIMPCCFLGRLYLQIAKRISSDERLFRLVTCLIIIFLFNNVSAAAPGFGFAKMEAFKFENETDGLNVLDINGDGYDDILFINNKRSRIEILLRNKQPIKAEQGNFKKLFSNSGFVVDQYIDFLKVTDFDQDGLVDIITAGSPLGINVRFQNKDHSFAEAKNIYLGDNIDFVDLHIIKNPGQNKLMLVREHDVEFIICSKNRQFTALGKIKFATNKCRLAILDKLSNTQYDDLLLYFSNTRPHLRIHPYDKEQRFGWGLPLALPGIAKLDKVFLNNRHLLGTVLSNRRVFRLYELDQDKTKDILALDQVNAMSLAMQGIKSDMDKAWCVADFNDDGNDDFCIAAPGISQLLIYYGTKHGLSSVPRKINTISDVNALAVDKNNNIIVYSATEKIMARHDASKLDKFPVLLTLPMLATTMASHKKTIYTLGKDKAHKNSYILYSPQWNADGTIAQIQQWKTPLKNAAARMLIFSLSATEKGVVFFIPYRKPEFFKLEKNSLKKLKTANLIGLSMELTLQQLGVMPVGDVDHLIICNRGVAYEYIYQNGAFSVVKQFNAANDSEAIITPLAINYNKKAMTLFIDAVHNNLLFFADQNYKKLHLNTDLAKTQGLVKIQQKNSQGLLFIGKNELHYLPQRTHSFTLKKMAEYASKTAKAHFWDFKLIQAGEKQSPLTLLALFDRNNRSFEFIYYADKKLSHLASIEVFKNRNQFAGKSRELEPNSLASGDVNGDGIYDLIILVHDRLIIYIGE
jgi:hypothetical protein